LVLKQLDWFHGNDGNTIVFLPFQLRLEGQATRFAGGRWLLNAWQGKKPYLLWFSMFLTDQPLRALNRLSQKNWIIEVL